MAIVECKAMKVAWSECAELNILIELLNVWFSEIIPTGFISNIRVTYKAIHLATCGPIFKISFLKLHRWHWQYVVSKLNCYHPPRIQNYFLTMPPVARDWKCLKDLSSHCYKYTTILLNLSFIQFLIFFS